MEKQNKKILGLDIGTNSIGGSLIRMPKDFQHYGNEGEIIWMGSRIIPETNYSKAFEEGQKSSPKNMTPAGTRRQARGSRRLKHRYKLRRTRLIKVFKELRWLDEDFPLDDSKKFKYDINENGFSFKISDYMPFSEETITKIEKEFGIVGKKSKKGKSIIPEDWIVYFLRKKALTEKITIPELVRIIYMLNQRRGFKSSRKDLKTTNVLPYNEFIIRKKEENYGDGIETQFATIAKIKSVTFKEEKKDRKGNISNVYTIEAEDPRMETWEEIRKNEPEWVGKEFTFLVTQKVDKKGKSSQLKPQIPKEDDWGLCTTALDEKINDYKTPGEYFYEQIKKAYLSNQNFKARQFPVYRWRYKKELEAIWKKQCELNPELQKTNSDKSIRTKIAEILYPTQAKNGMPKLAEFQNNDLLHIISNDIIYYQRELKSQKNSISECRYEKRKGIDGETYGLKCIPRSSPLFQEFRIWQDIHNIKVLKREQKVDGKTKLDVEVTSLYIDDNVKEKLFDLFNSKSSISEVDILNLIKENKPENDIVIIDKKDGVHSHRITLFTNRDALKGNETLSRYRAVFKKVEFDDEGILNDNEKLMKLWHIDYSITSSDEEKSKKGITTALMKLLPSNENKQNTIEVFCNLSELKKEYGSYSACAIKKLLPVMRCGKYWVENEISDGARTRAIQIKERLNDINNSIKRINEVADDDVQKQVLKSFIGKENLTKGLNTYQAGYLVYDKHSEKDKIKINNIEEFGKYIQKEIPNNSLRNPIVEQVVRETMFLVRDVWKKYGEIDEIHIEMGRNLKNNSDQRKRISDTQKGNFEEKQKIKKLLYELINDGFEQYVDGETKEKATFDVKPNPESPADINKFRVWRSLSNKSELEWAKKVKDEKIPTNQEIKKYALWLSQNCRSPYTGKIIPLSKLFDINQYEIEHVIPRAKMKNDSFNNLVISEWGVNKAKGKELAANFIIDNKGKCKYGDTEYKLFTYQEYESHCKETFKYQRTKLKNLLATEVPEDFISRQLNDTRYIGRKLSELLSPITKDETGIIFTVGSITSELKNNWGLQSVWKEIIKPRFERLEKITGNTYIVCETDEHGNPVYHFNVKENEGLNTKRIDHRHHALDALVVAATTRKHIRYLNTLNAADSDEEIKKIKQSLVKGKIRDFKEPWENFTKDAKDELEKLIVSFKTNNKIVTQPNNKTAYLKSENGKVVKAFKKQQKNEKWMAVRKSMFKEPQGVIHLKEIYSERNIVKAITIQINRMSVQNTSDMRIAPYVYDKEARQIIKQLIERIGVSIHEKDILIKEVKKYLKRNPLVDLSGKEYKSIKIAKFEEYAAKRVKLDKSFDHKKIDKIPYAKNGRSVLGRILHEHLDEYEEYLSKKKDIDNRLKEIKKKFPGMSNEDLKIKLSKDDLKVLNNPIPEPFQGEGLENLAKKAGKPITKVTIYEKKDESSKFGKRYVEVDAGSNVYFVMYENQLSKERSDFRSIATHKAIEKIVKREPIAEDKEGFDKIILSPGDLVYVPTKQEQEGTKEVKWNDRRHLMQRIYKVGRFSKKQCYFLKACVSDLIISYDKKLGYGEFSSTNYQEFDDEKNKIANVCIKLIVDRLGNLSKK